MNTLIKNPSESDLFQFAFLLGLGYSGSFYDLIDIKVEGVVEGDTDQVEAKLFVRLRNFRNGSEQVVDFTEEFNLMVGDFA